MACDACAANYYRDGHDCLECEDSGLVMIAIVFSIAALVFFGGLFAYTSRKTSAFSEERITIVLAAGLSMAAVQMLGAFRRLPVEWVEPLKTLSKLFGLFAFQVEFVRPECSFGPQKPHLVYLGSLLVYPAFALALLAVFGLAGFVGRRHIEAVRVINAEGIIFTALNLSLTIVGALAWQCELNPDGSYSVTSYRNVLCYESSDHHAMMAFSVVALLVYAVGFLALVFWATVQFPMQSSSSAGVSFMQCFKFMFNRFSTERYYFAAVFAVRGLLIALIPVFMVNEPHAQLLLMCMVLMLYSMAQARLWPWRVALANYLDAAFSICLMVLLVGGALLLDLNTDHGQAVIQTFFIIAVLLCIACAVVVLVRSVLLTIWPQKRYGAFLSHHKVGAAVLARWTKMLMQERVRERVFLDSDDVDFLDKLIDTVAYNCQNVVVLLTRETLERIWCAAEIASATSSGVNIVLVACDDWPGVSDEFLGGLGALWTHTQLTAVSIAGVELPMIERAYRELREMPQIRLHRAGSMGEQEGVLRSAIGACRNLTATMAAMSERVTPTNSTSTLSFKRGGQLQILGHLGDPESACTCCVLQLRLRRLVLTDIPICGASPTFDVAKGIIVVLTKGALESLHFASTLVTAHAFGVGLLPVRADETFVYPNPAYWSALRQGQVLRADALAAKSMREEMVETAYKAMFNMLALKFSSHGSDTIQGVEASVIAERLGDILGRADVERPRRGSL